MAATADGLQQLNVNCQFTDVELKFGMVLNH